ncbi:MAG: hypothetical protein R3199_01930 [Gemmatimonadota bacterium]|nr:hypothetical protein [Gemmatimonadota bacterium]
MRADAVPIALSIALALALPAGPAPLLGQQEIPPDTLELERPAAPPVTGTASYDAGGRRDPFVPLTAGLSPEEGPRFESLELTGVFLGTPGNSLVVLEDPANRGHFVRVGQRIGNARLIEVRPRSAVFQVTEYGTVRREVLELERPEERP